MKLIWMGKHFVIYYWEGSSFTYSIGLFSIFFICFINFITYFLLIEDIPIALPQFAIISDDLRDSVLQIPNKVRHDFPETWIWNEIDSRYEYL